MKLKQFQQEKIGQIIREELQGLNEGWSIADRFKKSSLLNEKRLFEGDSPLVDDLSASRVLSAVEQAANDLARLSLVDFDAELFEHIASVLRNHGLVSSGDDATSISESLYDYDETSMTDAQMSCTSAIANALDEYVANVSLIATAAYAGNKE